MSGLDGEKKVNLVVIGYMPKGKPQTTVHRNLDPGLAEALAEGIRKGAPKGMVEVRIEPA